jgi:hypothetical protein
MATQMTRIAMSNVVFISPSPNTKACLLLSGIPVVAFGRNLRVILQWTDFEAAITKGSAD